MRMVDSVVLIADPLKKMKRVMINIRLLHQHRFVVITISTGVFNGYIRVIAR